MVKILIIIFFLTIIVKPQSDKTPNVDYYFSGKGGYYISAEGLKSGPIFGVAGTVESNKHNFIVNGGLDYYHNSSVDVFLITNPKILQQTITIFPIHFNVGYKFLSLKNLDAKFYAGIGSGYNLFFYKVRHTLSKKSSQEVKVDISGGNSIFSFFLLVSSSDFFIEPKLFFTASKNGKMVGEKYKINSSGIIISVGYQL